MEALNVLDKVTEAIERVLKEARPVAKAERMTPDKLLAFAIAQIEKAANEKPDKAERRLRALGRTVEAAKQAFVDTQSETVEVQVFEEETTAAADESEKEISPVAAGAALGSSAFAENAEDLHKAIARVGKELEALRGGKGAAPSAGDKVKKGGDVPWPFDLNSSEFREGVRKAEDAPAWGYDPDHGETAKR
jgi:hypothetical protein